MKPCTILAVPCALVATFGWHAPASAQPAPETAVPAEAPAPERYRRLSVTANAVYLLIPIFELTAEYAVSPRWSVGVRGGAGQQDDLDEARTIWEIGAQGFYSFTGNVDGGFRVGIEGRVNHYEGQERLLGLGDGAAIGPMIGYKFANRWGMTMSLFVGPEFILTNQDRDPMDFPEDEGNNGRSTAYLYLGGGWSLLPNREADLDTQHERVPPEPLDPFDYHEGFAGGISFGGGLPVLPDCDECDFRPGVGAGGYLSYFVSRRFAVMFDYNSLVTVLNSGLGAMGVGAQVLAVQYWPHEDIWLKAGAGVTVVVAASFVGGASDTGGGGTLAGGYVFHRNRNFFLDAQLRANHASFDGVGDEPYAVDWFVAQLGLNWN